MKNFFKTNGAMLIIGLILTGFSCIAYVEQTSGDMNISDEIEAASLVLQDLNFTENPVDIPNPERGFERSNDDAAGLGAFIPDNPGDSNYWD